MCVCASVRCGRCKGAVKSSVLMSAYMWIVFYRFDSAVIVLVSFVALALNFPFILNNRSTKTRTPQEVIMPTLVSNLDEKKKDNRCVSKHSIDTCSKQGRRYAYIRHLFVVLSSMTHWVFHWEYVPGVILLLIRTLIMHSIWFIRENSKIAFIFIFFQK